MQHWLVLFGLTLSSMSFAAEQQNKWEATSTFSALLVTPLFSTNTYDKALAAWGVEMTGSIPLSQVMDNQLALEIGAGTTLARLTVSQPATSFTHWFLFFPVRLRLLFPLTDPWGLEVSLGALVRPWEYDSRDTIDGGFHRVTQTNTIEPDFNVGVLYRASESVSWRLRAGYMFLGAGAQFEL